MTHSGNYGSDRLAIFLFENAFYFISTWTNLEFHALPPLDTVEKYFELTPHDRDPVWTVCLFYYLYCCRFVRQGLTLSVSRVHF